LKLWLLFTAIAGVLATLKSVHVRRQIDFVQVIVTGIIQTARIMQIPLLVHIVTVDQVCLQEGKKALW